MIHRLDPEIERAFVGAIRIMCPTPIDPGVMNEMLYWYPDYTRAEIEAAMRRTLDSYRASYTHDAVLEQGMGYDVRTALYDGWSSWADTDARASVSAALCKLRNECIV
jgi:asparagine synthetase A